jgi:YlmC/YmxH family sporulation protein
MRLSDLQNKDVVDILTGEKVGNVIDVEISNDTGNILKMIIHDKKGLINMLRGGDEVSITWSQIKKIGTDVILISRNI